MKLLKNDALPYWAFCVCAIVVLLIAVQWVMQPFFPFPSLSYRTFAVSDWLINYQGGFVRRGLFGELLWQVYQIHPYPPIYMITAIDTIAILTFAGIMWHIFRKKQWSIIPIIIPFACCSHGFTHYRRDFLILCLCYLTYDRAMAYIACRRVRDQLFAVVLMVVCILSYEPIFFVMVPVIAWMMLSDRKQLSGKWQQVFLLLAIPTFCMAIVCLYKGTSLTAQRILQSWMPALCTYHDAQGGVPSLGSGLEWIGLDLSIAAKAHLYWNLGLWRPHIFASIAGILLILWLFITTYYTTSRVWTLQHKEHTLAPNTQSTTLGSVLLLQLVMMLPMFTILSCDYGRTIPTCIYTTFFIVYLAEKHGINIRHWRVCLIVDKYLSTHRLLRSPWFYLAITVLMPFTLYMQASPYNCLLYKMLHYAKIAILKLYVLC